MSNSIKVIIHDSSHPHSGQTGVLTGKVIRLFGKPMAEVKLDSCEDGTNACFVSANQVRKISTEKGSTK